MAELIEVRLDDNQINSIETLTFTINPKLKHISLANNQIGTIARNSFDALDQLELLNLADNALTQIGKCSFQNPKIVPNANSPNVNGVLIPLSLF
jgi:Leucine-rich repeat (LRR) protein